MKINHGLVGFNENKDRIGIASRLKTSYRSRVDLMKSQMRIILERSSLCWRMRGRNLGRRRRSFSMRWMGKGN
jgi:hypothetical protein